jgi:hypothetical protein
MYNYQLGHWYWHFLFSVIVMSVVTPNSTILIVIMKSFVLLNAFMLNVNSLNVVAPLFNVYWEIKI